MISAMISNYSIPLLPVIIHRLKNKSKTKLWLQYFKDNGRNLTMTKVTTFPKLIRVGLPNKLRGEIWEACSGSLYLRSMHPGEYTKLLKDNEGKSSLSLEEIEKDLNRQVPLVFLGCMRSLEFWNIYRQFPRCIIDHCRNTRLIRPTRASTASATSSARTHGRIPIWDTAKP